MAAVDAIRETGNDVSPAALVMTTAAISFLVVLNFVGSGGPHEKLPGAGPVRSSSQPLKISPISAFWIGW